MQIQRMSFQRRDEKTKQEAAGKWDFRYEYEKSIQFIFKSRTKYVPRLFPSGVVLYRHYMYRYTVKCLFSCDFLFLILCILWACIFTEDEIYSRVRINKLKTKANIQAKYEALKSNETFDYDSYDTDTVFNSIHLPTARGLSEQWNYMTVSSFLFLSHFAIKLI
jgi:hypothetical protein